MLTVNKNEIDALNPKLFFTINTLKKLKNAMSPQIRFFKKTTLITFFALRHQLQNIQYKFQIIALYTTFLRFMVYLISKMAQLRNPANLKYGQKPGVFKDISVVELHYLSTQTILTYNKLFLKIEKN